MFKAELKKFFHPILILIGLLICIVFYQTQLNFLYTFWPNGGLVPIYEYAKDWHDRFGETMSDADFEIVHEEYQLLKKETGQKLAKSEVGKENQINNYEDFEKLEANLPEGPLDELSKEDQQKREEWQKLYFEAESKINKISTYQWIEKGRERFQSEETFFKNREITKQDKKILSNLLFEKQGWRNIFPESLAYQVSGHSSSILTLILTIMSLLLATPFVKDSMLRLKAAQWSSKKGRNLIKNQYLATQLIAFVIISLGLLFFLGPILMTEFPRYFSSPLNSFFVEIGMDKYSYVSWTFGQLMLLLIAFVYLLGLSFSQFLFLIAQTSKNYLTMLMKIIPVLVVFSLISKAIIFRAFHMDNFLYELTQVKYVEIYSTGLILIISTLLGTLPISRIKKQELL